MIRVVTYNVSSAPDPKAAQEVVVGLRADVLALTEAPGRGRTNRIVRGSGLQLVGRSGKGATGVALLVSDRVRALTSDVVPLSAPGGAPSRAAVLAIVGLGSTRVAVAAVQLGLREEVRTSNVSEVEAALAARDAPAIVLGDLNENPTGPVPSRLSTVLVDAFAAAGKGRGETYPNPDPTVRRDYVFVDRSLPVASCWVPAATPIGAASRHRPVVAELAVDPAGTADPEA